ncbi:speckle-type POZ protein B-like [Uloborus diversus]|uniref:speckle-type POZ protein B-like n=1 Tax=Uloborus diversus TaxID=327109 RepID=UPI00240A7FF5|nr:speckle-type POZ protein B-like [Uloborus diversus]
MTDNVVFYWTANKLEVERYFFTTGNTTWSFGRPSLVLSQPPTLRRESNTDKDQCVKLKFANTDMRVKKYLSFSPGRLEKSTNLTLKDLVLPEEISERPVKIQCEFTVYSVFDFSVAPVPIGPVGPIGDVELSSLMGRVEKFDCLSKNLLSLLTSGDFSDLVLSCQSREIKVHKAILSSRSSVFAGMFLHQMRENINNRVEVADIEADVLVELMSYIYTGVAHDSDLDIISGLFAAAEKYDLQELKKVCRCFLQNKLSLDTVTDIIVLADIYSDSELKNTARKYILEHFEQLRTLESWNKFLKEHQNLGVEILSSVMDALLLQK